VDDIGKLTRTLDFFKHMGEAQRAALCRDMRLAIVEPGVQLHHSDDPQVPPLPSRTNWTRLVPPPY